MKAQLSWKYEPIESLPDEVKEANRNRRQKQPLDLPSCGSIFKNPEGLSAGKLIEDCGLKGFQIGGAQISPKHANFIVNTAEATAKDICQLITHVQDLVKSKKGLNLETEVQFLGSYCLINK